MWDVILDALLDTLKLSWLLLIFYILIEVVEQKIADKMHAKLKSNYAVAVGSAFGIIPQCGFSVLAADLYSRRQITLGALLAVFIATSDEALPILLSNIAEDGVWLKLLALILSKLILALVAGYAVDIMAKLIAKKRGNKQEHTHNEIPDKEEGCKEHTHAVSTQDGRVGEEAIHQDCNHQEHTHGEERQHIEDENHIDIHKGCCGHHIDDAKESNIKKYVIHPLLHTLKILAYILIINVVMGLIVYFVGEEQISAFMERSGVFQPIFVTLVGLIPNCASSVLITQLFLSNAISFGSCLGGLIVNAGLGIAFLFKENKRIKENVLIVVGLYAFAAVVAIALHFIV